jgi:enoyl-CoA hydratase/carnithine racemase
MSTEPPVLVVERHGRRRDLVLARPRARNAVSPAMLDALASAVTAAEADGVDVLVLRGQGSGFCAGADIRSYAGAGPEEVAAFTRRALALCSALEVFDGIVIAAVHGVCLGGGLELALACDLLVLAEDARLGLPEVRLGLIPGWGGTQRLTRVVGPAVARSMVLTSQVVGAERAAQIGLAHAVAAPDELGRTVDELASSLLAGPAQALRSAKRAIAAGSPLTDLGSARETHELLQLFASPDGQEGVAAFVEKRAPIFGRVPG